MRLLHRAVLLVLLLTVPFQAALGASGFLCAAGAHHSHDEAAVHNHGDGAGHGHEHGEGMSSVDPTPVSIADSHDSHGESGKCKICSECCTLAAPVPAAGPSVFPPDAPLRVSSIVGPGMISPTVGGLFRPPRTTSL